MGSNVLGHLIVLDRGQRRADLRLQIVEVSLRRGREHMHIDAGGIHVLEAARNVVTAGWEGFVDHPIHIQRRHLGVVRRDGNLGAGLGQQRGGFQRQDVGMGVDRPQLGHFRPLKFCFAAVEASCRTQAMDASPSARRKPVRTFPDHALGFGRSSPPLPAGISP
ncbi:MAG: hypothetical protein WDN48_10935 [Pseudolabrys sp.]